MGGAPDRRDTIFALATGPARAAIAIFRISGPEAFKAIEELTRAPAPGPRNAVLRPLLDVEGRPIDQGLVLFFPGPASFTGEDMAEFHVHGGRAVAARLATELMRLGVRPAAAGEFTRRAVENGKLDLTGAEALADLIESETEEQRRQAIRQYGGELARLCEAWRVRAVKAMASAEAEIDFSDEELPTDLLQRARADAALLAQEIAPVLDDRRRGEILRTGLCLTVIGPPNAGKSSLINALAGRDVAIVAETAGTTRDVIEVHLDLGGYPVTVADTAGLRDPKDPIESEGVRRALAQAERADLVLLLLDGSVFRLEDLAVYGSRKPDLVASNKSDLEWPQSAPGLPLSLKTGEGLAGLIAAIEQAAREHLERPVGSPVVTRARHRSALQTALLSLGRAAGAESAELVAEDLRLAAKAIGSITSPVGTEEVLDAIFRDFCIGK